MAVTVSVCAAEHLRDEFSAANLMSGLEARGRGG